MHTSRRIFPHLRNVSKPALWWPMYLIYSFNAKRNWLENSLRLSTCWSKNRINRLTVKVCFLIWSLESFLSTMMKVFCLLFSRRRKKRGKKSVQAFTIPQPHVQGSLLCWTFGKASQVLPLHCGVWTVSLYKTIIMHVRFLLPASSALEKAVGCFIYWWSVVSFVRFEIVKCIFFWYCIQCCTCNAHANWVQVPKTVTGSAVISQSIPGSKLYVYQHSKVIFTARKPLQSHTCFAVALHELLYDAFGENWKPILVWFLGSLSSWVYQSFRMVWIARCLGIYFIATH